MPKIAAAALNQTYGAPRRFRWAWAFFILALTSVPYFVNFWLTPKGFTYTWMVPPYPADSYAYRAWAKQAFEGRWLFSIKYTAVAQRPFLFLPFFLVAGRLARLGGADIGLVFLLLKSVGVLFFFWAFFGFVRHLKLTPFQSVAASILVGLTSGLGGIAPLILGQSFPPAWTPADSWLVDSNTFWSLLWNPLYPFSLALMILSVHWADRGLREADDAAAWRSGLCLGALALIHPYPLAVLYPLLSVLCVVRRPRNWLSFWLRLIAASAPAALYVVCLSLFHPLVRAHNDLGTQQGLSLFSAATGFGLPLALAAAGLFCEGPAFAKRYWPLVAWLGTSVALTACPIWFRTKFIFGAHVPVCILAGAAAEILWARLEWAPRWKTAACALVLLQMLSTPLVHLRECWTEVRANENGEYRIDAGMMAGLRFLETSGRRSDLVFASPWSSAKICAFAGDTVFWGHWAQAVDSADRQEWMRDIFADDSDGSVAERRRRFWDSGAEYVFLDGAWREGFKTGFGSQLLADAEKVFENDAVAIYRRRAAAQDRP